MLIKKFLKVLFFRYNGFHFLNFTLFVICFVFTTIDIISHLKTYYKYPVMVNTKLDYDDNITLPSITLCLPTIINLDQLKIVYPDIYSKVLNEFKTKKMAKKNYEWRDILAESLTIGELENLTPNFKKIILSCMVRTKKDKIIDCNRLGPIQNHFSLNHNCYVFFEKNLNSIVGENEQFNFDKDKDYDYSKFRKVDKNIVKKKYQKHLEAGYSEFFEYGQDFIRNKDWIRIVVNKSELWNGWINLGANTNGRFFENYHGQPNFLCLSTEITNLVTINFSVDKIERLKHPYESNCENYKSSGFIDRSHKIEECLGRDFLRDFSKWPFYLETNEINFPNLTEYYFTNHNISFLKYYSNCTGYFQKPNCHSSMITLELDRVNFCRNKKGDEYVNYQDSSLLDGFNVDVLSEESLFVIELAKEDYKNRKIIEKQKSLIENGSCNSKEITIIIQFVDENITILRYRALFEFWSLVGSIGQSVSVYLGLCFYDIHKLFGLYFDFLDIYNKAEKEEEPKNNKINFLNKKFKKFDLKSLKKNENRNFTSSLFKKRNRISSNDFYKLNFIKLSDQKSNKIINNQLSPFEWSKSNYFNNDSNTLYQISFIRTNYYRPNNDNKVYKKVLLNYLPSRTSVIYSDDYLLKVINSHKKMINN